MTVITRTDLPHASWFRQIAIMVKRNVSHTKRQPEMLSDVTIQPIMFVLLFAYVFAGMPVPGNFDYKEWLMPGIMGQTITFSAFVVALGINNDLQKGIIDRFRSLPISRSSVLVGRSIAGILHSSIGIVVMALTGLAVGWRIHDGAAKGLLAFVLIIVFGFAMVWVGILVGSALRSPEGVNGIMFATLFPITFVAGTFAPSSGAMPAWLQYVTQWNPLAALVQSLRQLWGNGLSATDAYNAQVQAALATGGRKPIDVQWPMQHPEVATLIWAVVITAIFAPLALRAYAKRTTD